MQIFLFLLLTAWAHADMGALWADLLGPPPRNPHQVSYGYKAVATKPTKSSTPLDFGNQRHDLQGKFTLSDDVGIKWRAHAMNSYQKFQTDALFPNGRRLPHSVWNIKNGVSYTKQLANENFYSVNLLLGSPSDKPFRRGRDVTFDTMFIYKQSTLADANWFYFVYLSNNRESLNYIPLPGIAYYFKASDSLRAILGLPFLGLFWRPTEKSFFSLFTILPSGTGQARISYFVYGPTQVYAQVKYGSDSYLLSERTDKKERLHVDEANTSLGTIWWLERSVQLDLSGGYSFARRYYLGRKRTSHKDGQKIIPENAPYALAKVDFAF